MGRYLQAGPGVWIPARVAVILGRHAGLDKFRIEVRGRDPELDEVLTDMAAAAKVHRLTTTGTIAAPQPEFSSEWLSTAEVAAHLGVTPRAVVHAIHAKRLQADWVGRWRIHRDELAIYKGR